MKIKPRSELESLAPSLKAKKIKIGFTSGVFDLLHRGHVEYLEKARALCDFLIVGVNDDLSVKANKGESRPINRAEDRAAVVAGLASVDAVLIFSEKNNSENVRLLKPDLYIKAGDYSKDKLSSAAMVESYGGKVEIVPMAAGYSTSDLIERIGGRAGAELGKTAPGEAAPVLFIDRDGTLIEHVEYLYETEKVKPIQGAMEALKKATDRGFKIVIVTNQPGIGLGYFTKEDYFRVNKQLLKFASEAGALIDKVYACPHSKSEKCRCRKPDTALFERAGGELRIDLTRSWMIGDTTTDIQFGKNIGVRTVLVRTGHGGGDELYDAKPDYTVKSMKEAVEVVLGAK